jgi:hypothetical protein
MRYGHGMDVVLSHRSIKTDVMQMFLLCHLFLSLCPNILFLNMKCHYLYISVFTVMSVGIKVGCKHTRDFRISLRLYVNTQFCLYLQSKDGDCKLPAHQFL